MLPNWLFILFFEITNKCFLSLWKPFIYLLIFWGGDFLFLTPHFYLWCHLHHEPTQGCHESQLHRARPHSAQRQQELSQCAHRCLRGQKNKQALQDPLPFGNHTSGPPVGAPWKISTSLQEWPCLGKARGAGGASGLTATPGWRVLIPSVGLLWLLMGLGQRI